MVTRLYPQIWVNKDKKVLQMMLLVQNLLSVITASPSVNHKSRALVQPLSKKILAILKTFIKYLHVLVVVSK